MKNTLLLSLLVLAMNVHAQLPAYIPTNNLVGWYPFNGNANNEAAIGSLTGTVNGATLTTDRYGAANKAYYFDGISNNITIDTTFFNTGWSDYTICFWANTDTIGNYHNSNNNQVMINTMPHNGLGFGNNWLGSGKYSIWVNSNPAMATWDILSNKRSQNNTVAHAWQHIAFVKQDDTSYSFYLNGQLDTNLHVATPVAASYYCKIMIGSTAPPTTPETFWGKLDDYGIWRGKLSPCDIKKMYKSTAYLHITTQPSVIVIGYSGSSVVLCSIMDTPGGNTYQWQVKTPASSVFTNIVASATYSGVNTNSLSVTNLPLSFSGNKYRCVVTGALCTDTSGTSTLTVWASDVKALDNNPSVSIAPNPTTGDLFVTGITSADIRVYNILGQLVKTEYKAVRISIAKLPNGIYVVKVFSDGALAYTGKVMKE